MRNSFLIARTVFFCILVYLNILGIGFAAWNVHAQTAAGLSVSGAPIFIIFNAARTAQVAFECGWTAVLSILQLAAAVDVSINGPPDYCSAPSLIAVCSSSTALTALSWASSTILMMYFLTLFITSVSHYGTYRGVWWTTVYNVPWFDNSHAVNVAFPSEGPAIPAKDPSSPYENPVFRAHEDNLPLTPPHVPFAQRDNIDLERASHSGNGSSVSLDSCRPVWAKSVKTRRGVDPPFSSIPGAAQRISRALKSYWSGATNVPPTPPPKPSLPLPDHLSSNSFMNDSGFVDCHRASYGHFPHEVEDIDLPIARTHMKEWVKADRAVLAH
ncbi:hypothetical protein BDW22DRAFT_275489 [Trametopsis cervina]|nr:hypothetical protein BDW22DRAFT_275489 [Trametopsis cervina]